MRKVLVLMVVLAAVSVASATPVAFDHGIVRWRVDQGLNKFIGEGIAPGIYNHVLENDPAVISPTTGTDSGIDGVLLAAGNRSDLTLIVFDTMYLAHAEDLELLPDLVGTQEKGVWFCFDIVSVGTIDIYESPGVIAHTMDIPEPATMGLLSLGGLVLLRRRKK